MEETENKEVKMEVVKDTIEQKSDEQLKLEAKELQEKIDAQKKDKEITEARYLYFALLAAAVNAREKWQDHDIANLKASEPQQLRENGKHKPKEKTNRIAHEAIIRKEASAWARFKKEANEAVGAQMAQMTLEVQNSYKNLIKAFDDLGTEFLYVKNYTEALTLLKMYNAGQFADIFTEINKAKNPNDAEKNTTDEVQTALEDKLIDTPLESQPVAETVSDQREEVQESPKDSGSETGISETKPVDEGGATETVSAHD